MISTKEIQAEKQNSSRRGWDHARRGPSENAWPVERWVEGEQRQEAREGNTGEEDLCRAALSLYMVASRCRARRRRFG